MRHLIQSLQRRCSYAVLAAFANMFVFFLSCRDLLMLVFVLVVEKGLRV